MPQSVGEDIACPDCHFSGAPRAVGTNALNDIERKLLELRGWTDDNPRFLALSKQGHALLNSTLNAAGQPVLLGKNYRNAWPLMAPAPVCDGAVEGHDRLSCQSCHSAWAPQCIQCHTQREGGVWMEYAGEFLAGLPTLGVREAGNSIEPHVPGMILTLNTNRRASRCRPGTGLPRPSHDSDLLRPEHRRKSPRTDVMRPGS